MKLSARHLLFFDKVFWLPYKALEILFAFRRKPARKKTDVVIVIKLMGMGSIAQLVDLCRQHQADRQKIKLLTFSSHSELCQLLGIDGLFIRTEKLLPFISDCFNAFHEIKKTAPSFIIDFERCSNAVSIFRMLLAAYCRCSTLSFRAGKGSTSPVDEICDVRNLNQYQLFEYGIQFMPKKLSDKKKEWVEVQSNKIIININASDYSLARRYPVHHFIQLIQLLYQTNPQLEIYLTGTAAERDYVNSVVDVLNVPVHNVSGKWSLETLLNELATCAVFISCDSGPLHLASYLNIPTIAIWGPTQPEHFGYTNNPFIHNITLNLPCAPCLKHPNSKPARACKGRVDCLGNLHPISIKEKVVEIQSTLSPSRLIHIPAGLKLEKFAPDVLVEA